MADRHDFERDRDRTMERDWNHDNDRNRDRDYRSGESNQGYYGRESGWRGENVGRENRGMDREDQWNRNYGGNWNRGGQEYGRESGQGNWNRSRDDMNRESQWGRQNDWNRENWNSGQH